MRLEKKAIERGYDPKMASVIYNVHVEDAERSGRPSISLEKQQEIVVKVITDRHRREKSTVEIAGEVKKYGYKKVKPTWKPDLTPAMKKARLEFAIQYKDWTIEDWKRVY